ncbi:MAG: Lrp/AsnC family transcriptional regulator [Candidatus Woesearchaeota archaeon]
MAKYNHDLLLLYSENARAKIKDLAQILKKSPQRIKYQLRVIERDEIVHNMHAVLDYSYLGLLLFRIYFKGGYISENDKQDIIKKLSDNPFVVTIYEMGGGFDLVVEFIAPNPSRFNKEFKKAASIIPTLNNYKVVLNIVTHLYPRTYLSEENTIITNFPSEIIIGGDRTVVTLTENERLILNSLLQNPRQRLTTLAKSTSLNIKTVNSTIKLLKQKKILKGYKFVLNTISLKIHKYRLFLKLHNITKEREDQLLEFMLKKREIVQLNKTVGDWDVEVDIESLSRERIRELTIEIRETFKDFIETFNMIEFFGYFKKSYLPRYYFEEQQIEGNKIKGNK